MPASPIQILDYSKGMKPDQTKAVGFSTMALLDPHTEPGILRVNPRPLALTGTTDGVPLDMEIYDENGGTPAVFVYDDTQTIYEIVSGVVTSRHTVTSGDAGFTLKSYQTSLYYTWYHQGSDRIRLGKLTGDASTAGNYTDSFATLNEQVDDTGFFCPMVVFAGALYVANGRYVSKVESDEITVTNQAFIAPSNLIIQSMHVYNDQIVMGTVSGDKSADEYILFWDGVSDYADSIIKVPKPGASALMEQNFTLFAFIGPEVYYYTGSDFQPAFAFPKNRFEREPGAGYLKVYPGAVDVYKKGMFFGTSEVEGYTLCGTFALGRNSAGYDAALTFAHVYDSSQTYFLDSDQQEPTVIKSFKSSSHEPAAGSLYIGYTNGEIHYVNEDMDLYTEGAYLLTEIYDTGDFNGRLFKGVRLQFGNNLLSITNQVLIKYRIDNDINLVDDTASWTTLGTYTMQHSTVEKILYGIYKRAKRIQFRFEFTTTGNLDSMLAGIYLY